MPIHYSKINVARLIVGIVLLTGVIKLFLNISSDSSFFEILNGKKLTLGLELRLMYHARTFLNPLILLLAIIGFLIQKPVGWILTNNIFTYALSVLYLIILPVDNSDWYYYFIGIVPIGLIILMNQGKIVKFHKISKSDLLTLNLLTIVSGLVLTFIWGYLSLNTGENYWDIIYNK